MKKVQIRVISWLLLLSLLLGGCAVEQPVNTDGTTIQVTTQATEVIQEATLQTQGIDAVTQPTQQVSETQVATQPAIQETEPPKQTQPTEAAKPSVPAGSSFQIHFIDVGQADAALILCDGKAMLIDGGNKDDSNVMYTYLKKNDISYLDYVVGTHPHEDHVGGIPGALNYATAGTVYIPQKTNSTKAYKDFITAANNKAERIVTPKVGDTFSLGSAQCTILAVDTEDDNNNSSIVMRIVYGNTSFMFTGDAEREVENHILDSGATVKSTVLKVGHHGSNSSTQYRWLREVAPEYAVICVGKGNSYGHPTENTLSRLRDAEVTTFRTDLQGDIICTSDGNTVSFTTARNKDIDTLTK